ncbi:MAG: DNA gyrase subunit A, partial [Pseudomonadota bacterium]
PFNLNVLAQGQVPMVLDLKQTLQQWLDHRQDVLQRRTRHRLERIAHRLEVLAGLLIAYLNLDEVIRIIRFEDKPKEELIARFELTDVQATAILDMRLRALNKLQELEIQREHDELTKEQAEKEALLADEAKQWDVIRGEVAQTKRRFGGEENPELGKRRTSFGDAPEIDIDLDAALIEKEPITVVLSEKGWIRALKGHQDDLSKVTFKDGDGLKFGFTASTTDKLLLAATSGKFYTLAADKLPGGRGAGEPVRLMLDLDETADIAAAFVHVPGRKLVVASTAGNGFVVPEDDLIALKRTGRQVLNLGAGEELAVVRVARAGTDRVAVVSDARKLLIFDAEDLPAMTRGKGVRLIKMRAGQAIADVQLFEAATGLQWRDTAGRIHTAKDWPDWHAARASAGRDVPKGFPKAGRFGFWV